jgi:hypothetical protein
LGWRTGARCLGAKAHPRDPVEGPIRIDHGGNHATGPFGPPPADCSIPDAKKWRLDPTRRQSDVCEPYMNLPLGPWGQLCYKDQGV